VIGDDASANPIFYGEGSGYVVATNVITPLAGIKARVGSSVTVNYASSQSVTNAVKVASTADIAIIFVGVTSSEGSDRTDLSLGASQNALVSAVIQAQPNSIVVVHSPGAVLMPWAGNAEAIICAFLPGEEDGHSIADVLFGDVNPGGKLPVTFPASENQIPVNTIPQYPGINNEAAYSEQLLVGYRWYDVHSYKPLFPFGHGLSYTTFDYRNLQINGALPSGIMVNIEIYNTGKRSGAEVVQLYVRYPTAAHEPTRSLRGFRKVLLHPSESKTVTFKLENKDVSIWDVNINNWSVFHGTFTIDVGSSSRDIRASGTFVV